MSGLHPHWMSVLTSVTSQLMLINLKLILLTGTQEFFLSKFLLKGFTAGYFVFRATTVEVTDCNVVPLETQNHPKPNVSYRGMAATSSQSSKEAESLVPNQHKYLNGRNK